MTKAIAITSGGAAASAPGLPSPVAEDHRPQLEQAKLELFDSKEVKGGRQFDKSLGTITFQFNPKEVTISKAAKWARVPAKDAKSAGPPEFNGAEPSKLTMEMFFDASGNHDGSVVAVVEQLFSCCVPTEKSRGDKKPYTPLVQFSWGQVRSFPAFITQLSAKFTLFAPEGTPIRAVCSVTLEEMPGDPDWQNPTSGGLAVHRAHTLVEGDSLASVAYREYGDPGMWRPLADYNGIDDPMRIQPGRVLLLPAPHELLSVS